MVGPNGWSINVINVHGEQTVHAHFDSLAISFDRQACEGQEQKSMQHGMTFCPVRGLLYARQGPPHVERMVVCKENAATSPPHHVILLSVTRTVRVGSDATAEGADLNNIFRHVAEFTSLRMEPRRFIHDAIPLSLRRSIAWPWRGQMRECLVDVMVNGAVPEQVLLRLFGSSAFAPRVCKKLCSPQSLVGAYAACYDSIDYASSWNVYRVFEIHEL